MIRTMLIATVAALAITAPASAQDRGDRGKRGDQAEKAKAERSGQRAERQERAPRVERRAEPQESSPRVERRAEQQERAPRVERRAERQERAPRAERRVVQRQERAPRAERRVMERQERAPRAELRVVERRARQVENRVEATNRTVLRRARQAENRAEASNRTVEPRVRQAANRAERAATLQRLDNRDVRQDRRADQRQNGWDNLAQRRSSRIDDNRSERRVERRIATIGHRIDPVRYDNVVPFAYRARYQDTPQHYYRYNDDAGYLYQVRRDNNLVSALVPLLGGAYSVGRPLPLSYSSYNVPYGYRDLYYDTPDHYYRYGSGAIYQVDSGSNLIQAVVALLTGQNFGVGQMLPAGYSAYNVPYDYRDRYQDTADNWYRYNDGNIYQVDARTRMIEDMYPMSYGGFAVGSPMPYGYDDYNVPYGYRDVYFDTPDYNYRYANGGIYQVDPTTQMVQALVALVTGQSFNVGQQMPDAYGVYNVPYDYRDRYADSDDNWYRYNDGTIYQIDPGTRVIRDRYNIYA